VNFEMYCGNEPVSVSVCKRNDRKVRKMFAFILSFDCFVQCPYRQRNGRRLCSSCVLLRKGAT